MSRKLLGCGVVALAFCMAAGGAEAKLVRYEIQGNRYSYSTNNIQQTREARQRIDAANAAAAAKARAEAERAANPIARIFGSRTQREAAEAQARLEQNLTSRVTPNVAPQDTADFESTSSVRRSRAESRRFKRESKTRVTRAERKRALREARVERRRKLASARVQTRPSLSAETPRAETPRAKAREEVTRAVEARNRVEPTPNLPAVEKIHTGGDQPSKNIMPVNASAEPAGGSLTDFVNQVRKALP